MSRKLNDFLDSFVLFVALVGLLSIALLALGWFQVPVALFGGLLVAFIIGYQSSPPQGVRLFNQGRASSHLVPLLCLLLIALLFRAQPYFYVMGGQDQGVYVNMSAAFEQKGSIFQTDEVREKLRDDSIRELYKKYNYKTGAISQVSGEREGEYLPGIYIKDASKSELVFQFYHLHPLWMAIFGTLFGSANRVYALTFFSILSIIYLYLLAYELSDNRFLAFATGVLIALNPLHAYFSKFPVTEVPALFFSSAAFYYLLRYYKTSQHRVTGGYDLLCSALLMGSFFFTRITGFLYLPFFYLLIVLSLCYVETKVVRRHFLIYYVSIFGFYILSVLYGTAYSFPYSLDIYQHSFSYLFGQQWEVGTLFSSALIVIVIPVFHLGTKQVTLKQYFRVLLQKISYLPPYVLIVLLGLGLYEAYQLGFSDIYEGNRWYDLQWDMVGYGLESFLYSSLVVSIIYISPFLFLLFLVNVFTARTYHRLLLVFLLIFWLYLALFQWVIPYQYYYARYALSEVVPYSILLAVSASGWLLKRRYTKGLLYGILLLTASSYLYYSVHQLQGEEAEGAYTTLSDIASYVDEDDLLLLYRYEFHFESELKTPLVYLFGKDVFTYNYANELESYILPRLIRHETFNDLFLLSQKRLYLSYLDSVDTVTYHHRIYEQTNFIPTEMTDRAVTLYLYRVNEANVYHHLVQEHNQLFLNSNPYLVKRGFFEDGVWTSHHAEISNFEYATYEKKYLILETNRWQPLRKNLAALNLDLSANGRELELSHHSRNRYYFLIPEGMSQIDRIDIYVNTFVPSQLIAGSQDDRNLGLDVREIRFE